MKKIWYIRIVSLYRLFPVEQRPDVGRHRHVYYDPFAGSDFFIASSYIFHFQICENFFQNKEFADKKRLYLLMQK